MLEWKVRKIKLRASTVAVAANEDDDDINKNYFSLQMNTQTNEQMKLGTKHKV